MEFELNSFGTTRYGGQSPTIQSSVEKEQVVAITKSHHSVSSCSFKPRTSNWKYSRDISIDLLFGDTELARKLKTKEYIVPIASYLTLTSSNTGKLVIKTEGMYPTNPFKRRRNDLFKALYKAQESLHPLSKIEFVVSFQGLYMEDAEKTKLNFTEKGLKLTQEEWDGPVSLEMKDLQFPENIWWKKWRDGKVTFIGGFTTINLRLDIAAVADLFRERFVRDTLAIEIGTATDLVILVGGNKDKDKAIKCHKSILSNISPVFAAMFQTDMLEAKENTLEIVDFSEDVIRAFMEFAYWGIVELALKSSEMALELLQLSVKYEMKELKDILLQMIWVMPLRWFSVKMLFKLVLFTKNAGEDLGQAVSKGWMALKWYAKRYPEKLMESMEMEKLCEEPRAVKELMVQLLNMM